MRILVLCLPLAACSSNSTADGGMDATTQPDTSMMVTDSGTDSPMMMDSGTDSGIADTGIDTGVVPEGGFPPQQITCGPKLTCMASETCCVSLGGMTTYACTSGSCQMGDTALKCSRTSDCAMGNVCCAHIDSMKNVTSQCLLSCPSGPNDAQLCSNMDMPTGCMNVICSSNNIGTWNLTSDFATCGGKAH